MKMEYPYKKWNALHVTSEDVKSDFNGQVLKESMDLFNLFEKKLEINPVIKMSSTIVIYDSLGWVPGFETYFDLSTGICHYEMVLIPVVIPEKYQHSPGGQIRSVIQLDVRMKISQFEQDSGYGLKFEPVEHESSRKALKGQEAQNALRKQIVSSELEDKVDSRVGVLMMITAFRNTAMTLKAKINSKIKGNKNLLDKNVQRDLKALKKDLLVFSSYLDRILLDSDKFDSESSQSICEEIRRVKESLANTLNIVKAEKLREYLRGELDVEYDILADIAGLDESLRRKLAEFRSSELWGNHLDDFELICHIMENTFTDRSKKFNGNLIHDLETLGFLHSRAKTIADRIKTEFENHRSCLDWAKLFLEDLFASNLLLTDSLPLYPLRDKPFGIPYPIPNPIKCHSNNIEATNFKMKNDKDYQKVLTTCKERYVKSDEIEFWFHGTSQNHASDILSRGIKLKEGGGRQDFSHKSGFYLGEEFDLALDWARTRSPKKEAVLVFRIPKDFLNQYNGISFSRQNTDDVKKWNDLVTYNRSGEELYPEVGELMADKEFVIGPYGSGKLSDGPINLHKKVKSNQLCIIDNRLARDIMQHLEAVIFLM